ncbi:MAG: isopentenyl pyrophosphate isomerase [Thermoproteus sp. JCHS_4]|jgi:isopentenyl-diphosphate delta-isomerase|nr:MAG: isopentenyl pyrophosphate isomerase [Thermoproteus sp. JCHS_4]
MIDKRKNDHIFLAASPESQVGDSWLDDVVLIHRALPELDLDDVDTRATFLGSEISMPFIIGAMTGGTELAEKINARLAKAAEELRVPMYVGSQRIGMVKPEARRSFEVVRSNAPTVPKIANLGAPQISRLSDEQLLRWAEEAVGMIDAAALAVHLNPAQEVFQPEGEPHFRNVLERLRFLKRALKVQLIVKEVGNGISKEVASLLNGVADIIDVAGAGGTSFVAIEALRAKEERPELYEMSEVFKGWGIPTAAAICEVKSAFRGLVIASGGIRNGLDGARALSLGADYFSASQPLLKAALDDRVAQAISKIWRELRVAMFLTGAAKIQDLRRAPKVLGPRLESWLRQRGVGC